ncbi:MULTISPECIES: AraC family transcriptional regulator [unclassified Sinorhizobium]|uniref:AraC family transcriptional regulator n=1 Tax=unclassified Sinorhizobium TaxID=2613772 RepID=UPI0024C34AF8|nr:MULTISPECIES: AraC family transcriptional regulator [unclassified Sinorhizobium]MDK1373306.1 AraC family transcriptional regulator [Sinorhizobium sp. 6-70]MDK1481796.1 AraC family transcriptional regulator [Sinorhizobium sp. 6-117]
MAGGAYGERLGEAVGAEAPPSILVQRLQRTDFAATRVSWGKRESGRLGRIEREDGYLVCLQLLDLEPHPYWVEGRPVTIAPIRGGQFTLLDLNCEHSSVLTDPIDCLAIYISRQSLDRIAEERGVSRTSTIGIAPGVPLDDVVVRSLGTSLLPSLEAPEQASQLFLDHVGMALLGHLGSAYGDMPGGRRPKRGGLAPWQERRAKEILMAHLDGDIALEELAHECGLSRSHFARAFKETTGAPPHRWLLARRIERAQDLLLNTSLSITEIANSCGFADQSHFTRVFAKMVETGPGEWRRCRRW